MGALGAPYIFTTELLVLSGPAIPNSYSVLCLFYLCIDSHTSPAYSLVLFTTSSLTHQVYKGHKHNVFQGGAHNIQMCRDRCETTGGVMAK